MSDREVKKTKKDGEGDILALCNTGEHWSPRRKVDVISDIESRVHRYFVRWPEGNATDIHVVNGSSGKYLRTDRDNTTRNNLDDLPGC